MSNSFAAMRAPPRDSASGRKTFALRGTFGIALRLRWSVSSVHGRRVCVVVAGAADFVSCKELGVPSTPVLGPPITGILRAQDRALTRARLSLPRREACAECPRGSACPRGHAPDGGRLRAAHFRARLWCPRLMAQVGSPREAPQKRSTAFGSGQQNPLPCKPSPVRGREAAERGKKERPSACVAKLHTWRKRTAVDALCICPTNAIASW